MVKFTCTHTHTHTHTCVQELWYYHLSAASAGDLGPVLTHTERLLAKIMQEGGGASHVLWKHPVLTCTGGPLRRALTSLASAELNQVAKNLFQVGVCVRVCVCVCVCACVCVRVCAFVCLFVQVEL